MVVFNKFEISKTGDKIIVETSCINDSYATEFRLYSSYSYPDKNKAFVFNSKLEGNSSTQSFEINANEIGELIFEGLIIGEIVYNIPSGANVITYTKQAVAVNMTKIYTCLVNNATNLEVDCCKLLLTDSSCICVDDVLHSFIELESFKILLKNEEFKLATEVFNSLNEKCTLNCIGLDELTLYPGIGIKTIDNKIVE